MLIMACRDVSLTPPFMGVLGLRAEQGNRFNLNRAVDLTAKNAKITKKGSYEWMA